MLGKLPYELQAIRVSVQLLSGDLKISKILRIAELESLKQFIHLLAKDILSIGFEHKNWKEISDSTSAEDFPEGVVTHPTRYVVDLGNYVPENQSYGILAPKTMLLREVEDLPILYLRSFSKTKHSCLIH